MEYGDFSLNIHEKAGTECVIKAQMELTYRCNLHCRHCYTDPFNRKEYFPKEMELAEVKRILDEMAALGILWLNFTGGEALMRKDFFEIYDYAWAKGFILTLYTNGTMITESVINKLKDKPPFFIDVSCHSITEESFDWFTQVKGSFRHFLKSMELLKASGLPFRMKTIGMNWNKKELPYIKEYVESFGISFHPTTALYPRLTGDLEPLKLRLSPEEAVDLQVGSEVFQEDECLDSDSVYSTIPNRLYRCTCATNAIHINAWAELGTCGLEYEARASLREYSLKEAISQVFEKVRSLRFETNTPCRDCSLFSFCNKKPTSARWEFKDPQRANPYECDVAFLKASRLTGKTQMHPLKKEESGYAG